jgi:hypothetical protein
LPYFLDFDQCCLFDGRSWADFNQLARLRRRLFEHRLRREYRAFGGYSLTTTRAPDAKGPATVCSLPVGHFTRT